MKLAASLMALIAFGIFASHARATMVAFTGYSETGNLHAPFTDAPSSIIFSNPQNSGGYFGIDYGSAVAGVPDLPGNMLTGNSYVAGNQFSLTQNFGFDAAFGAAAKSVTIDVIYLNDSANAGTVTLSAFDSKGTQVGTTTITPTRTTASGYLQAQLTVPGPANNIRSISIRSSNLAAAFDDVNVVAAPSPTPEPGALAIALLASPIALLKRRARA
jgi:hypothetical protein